jgi:DNA-binding CsgD family transcriptional regulator
MTSGPELLSAREHDVLQLLARGHTNREVAEHLHISVRTAEWYRASIRRKLDITSRAGLVDFATAHGLVQFGVWGGNPTSNSRKST